MKTCYIPIAVLTLLMAAALAVGLVTERQTVLWEKAADQVDYAASADDWPRVEKHLTALSDSWAAWQTFLHITLPHDHITDTAYELEKARYHAQNRDADHLRESLTELRGHFRTLSDQGELSLRNLL